ncbi:hypothetical protein PPACK8108_LOCUS759 [Phakopsora pachyrhizi]|uniref:Secreted protein n=1 Tax=Phakopsora pachyrhizi TaxID=170000 RepID=A0AAV0AGX5_PHAPC|nr:hypothetical protein PPACK8108_LOCUS759 [Phakopsora pachyrhizi]
MLFHMVYFLHLFCLSLAIYLAIFSLWNVADAAFFIYSEILYYQISCSNQLRFQQELFYLKENFFLFLLATHNHGFISELPILLILLYTR